VIEGPPAALLSELTSSFGLDGVFQLPDIMLADIEDYLRGLFFDIQDRKPPLEELFKVSAPRPEMATPVTFAKFWELHLNAMRRAPFGTANEVAS
jgi:hypothetical protein